MQTALYLDQMYTSALSRGEQPWLVAQALPEIPGGTPVMLQTTACEHQFEMDGFCDRRRLPLPAGEVAIKLRSTAYCEPFPVSKPQNKTLSGAR